MDTIQANPYEVLAAAFCYPDTGHIEFLSEGAEFLPAGAVRKAFLSFLQRIGGLPLSDWEELHTRTLDLNPPAAPYLGFQTWGESYQRGAFLAKMSREVVEGEIDAEGELPDHLIPVLRYLAQAESPLPELVEIFEPSVKRMAASLRQSDPANPYLHLLDGLHSLAKSLPKEAV